MPMNAAASFVAYAFSGFQKGRENFRQAARRLHSPGRANH
jgi:hypothetical protein